MNKNLYETLGVDKDATDEEIKAAYRKKAKENHPDKKGGDKEKMVEITLANSILSDKEKRKRYDETGETKTTPFHERFIGFVSQLFFEIIEKTDNYKKTDLINEFRHNSFAILDTLKKQKKDNEKLIKKFSEVLERITSPSDQFITMTLKSKINDLKTKDKNFDTEIKFIEDCIEVIKHYQYKVDIEPEKEKDPMEDLFFKATTTHRTGWNKNTF